MVMLDFIAIYKNEGRPNKVPLNFSNSNSIPIDSSYRNVGIQITENTLYTASRGRPH